MATSRQVRQPPRCRAREADHNPGDRRGEAADLDVRRWPSLARWAGEPPLSALLSQLLIALTIETDNEYERRSPAHFTTDYGSAVPGGPWITSYAMYANFLRLVPSDGVRMADLAAAAGFPPPVHPAYHGMRRWGYVTYSPDIAGSSPKKKDADALVRCTAAGGRSRETWATTVVELRERVGRPRPRPAARGARARGAILRPRDAGVPADHRRP